MARNQEALSVRDSIIRARDLANEQVMEPLVPHGPGCGCDAEA